MSYHARPPRGQGGPAGPGDRGPGRGRPVQAQEISELWPGYLKGGYFDSEGHLKPEYVSRETVEPLVRAMCKDGDRWRRDGLTASQVRRYFGHCRALETRLKSAPETSWAAIVPEIKKLDIAAADGFHKQPQPKIPDLFHDFIRRNVAAIRSQKDFLQGFLPHFEALVGFGTAHFKKERN